MLSDHDLDAFFAQRGRLLLDPSCLLTVRDPSPLPIYAQSAMQLVKDRRDNVKRLCAISRAFRSCGVTDVRHVIGSVHTPASGRVVAHITFHHLSGGQHAESRSDLVYYLQSCSRGIHVAMLEVLQCPAYALAAQHQFRLPG